MVTHCHLQKEKVNCGLRDKNVLVLIQIFEKEAGSIIAFKKKQELLMHFKHLQIWLMFD